MRQQRSFLETSLPTGERPADRLRRYGAGALSQTEILALLIGGQGQLETAAHLLALFGSMRAISQADIRELARVSGIGPVAAARIKAALELDRRNVVEDRPLRAQVRSPADAFSYLRDQGLPLKQTEELWVLSLGTKNHIEACDTIYAGSVNTTLIRAAEVFRPAIRCLSSAIIVAHNHPSGDPTPSPEDVQVTGQLVACGKTLDIEIMDHLIVADKRYTSMKERKLGW